MENPNTKYRIKTEQYDVSYEQYTDFERTFGAFSEDGRTYSVTDRNTPRQWLNFMVNDRFVSVAANDGSGFTALDRMFLRVTKFCCETDYLVRTLDGRRIIILKDIESGKEYDLLKDSADMVFEAKTGSVTYKGSVGNIHFNVEIFVPNNDTCEFWLITLSGNGRYILSVSEDIALANVRSQKSCEYYEDMKINVGKDRIDASTYIEKYKYDFYAHFSMHGGEASYEKLPDSIFGAPINYTRATLSKEIVLTEESQTEYVISGAGNTQKDIDEIYEKYQYSANILAEKEALNKKWDGIVEKNNCILPDKNLQHFLNVWLKNQVYMTLRYNRASVIGYRDLIQDAWGHLLVKIEDTRAIILEALSQIYTDGRCIFKYSRNGLGSALKEDVMDSPLWLPIAICDYIKETGDFDILSEQVGYLDSDKTDTVKEHILLTFDHLYHARGKNGLLLMRDGDWLDGLMGINKYGEATSVWGTIAAFHGQNLLAELFEHLGDHETANMLTARSAEYKRIVNEVAWDGNWYVYAFIDDEAIGSHRCHEGKIFLNPQSWAIMSGIYDEPKKLEKMYRSVNTYLMTVYGPQLNGPAYTKLDERLGTLTKQRPGTFANGGIYLHAASFMAAAYCADGKYDHALDLMQRILPGHEDHCDARRTSEPYTVGNIYYGSMHPCHGENLYTWFTAAPAWLIHVGFEGILGVKADYNGLKIIPRQLADWEGYSVQKLYRGTKYTICFEKGDDKGIFVDGVRIAGNTVRSENAECQVKVIF